VDLLSKPAELTHVGQQPPTYPLLLGVRERRYLGDCLFECLHHEIRCNRSWTRKEKRPRRRSALRRSSVPSSSAPISREYPATSAARIAARRRVWLMPSRRPPAASPTGAARGDLHSGCG